MGVNIINCFLVSVCLNVLLFSFSVGPVWSLQGSHRHNSHCTKRYREWQTVPMPPPIPHFWKDNFEQPLQHPEFENHPDYIPIKLEYPLSQYHRNVDSLDDKGLVHLDHSISKDSSLISSQELFDPQLYPYRSIPDEHPVVYQVRKKTKSKKRKKKPINSMIFPSGVEPTTPDYSINKIIVIEDSDAIAKYKDEQPQLERPIVIEPDEPASKLYSWNDNQLQPVLSPNQGTTQTYGQIPVNSIFGSVPIKSMQDIHYKLNQTLLTNPILRNTSMEEIKPKTQYQESVRTIMNPVEVKQPKPVISTMPSLIDFINKIPQNRNISLVSSPASNRTAAQQFTQSSDFFMKANKFAFQNSWNYLTSTDSSTIKATTEAPTTVVDGKVGDRLISSDTINRHWHSTTMPSTYFFTSQRNVIPTPSSTLHITTKSVNKNIDNDVNYAARKRGQTQNDKIQNVPIDIAKVGSIIIGFCVSMMLLAGVILLVLHKDSVSEHFRNIGGTVEGVRPTGNENRSQGVNRHMASSNSNQIEEQVVHQHVNQDLIEQVIGRPENSFNDKKCRQYFSRVHRWVPKRTPLPGELKTNDNIQQ